MLGGQKYESDTEVQSVIHQWLRQRSASFFVLGIQFVLIEQMFEQTWTIY